mgnify:FL=1
MSHLLSGPTAKAAVVSFYVFISVVAVDAGTAWSLTGLAGLGPIAFDVVFGILLLPTFWIAVWFFRRTVAVESRLARGAADPGPETPADGPASAA